MRMAGRARLSYLRPMGQDEQWAAVEAHDGGADGAFVYAVRSTGIYCRPSCPSRRPLRRNVEFFDGSADAEAGGYRPCLRCRPEAAGPAAPGRAAQAVVAACGMLEQAGEALSVEELAGAVGLSPSYLQRSFKRLVGSTPRQYAAAARLERAKAGMRSGSDVTESLFDAGYGSTRAFYEDATGALGMPPATYRRGGAAQEIFYTTVPSPLGTVLVAATAVGVCAVRFVDPGHDDRTEVEAALRAEFPAATLTPDDDGLKAAAAAVVEAAAGGGHSLDLPLDVRSTAFQLRVWRALREIPRGETRSYTQVARAIGQPRAVRAVASACAANPVALVVPCHRVVAAGGGLAGYRWGVDRKRALLDAERTATAPTP